MIRFSDMARVFAYNLQLKYCLEIEFQIIGDDVYTECFMGKMPDEEGKKYYYWYGLTPDGKNAYEFESFDAMADAPVFHGKSLIDLWDQVNILTVDGCDAEWRIKEYLGK